MIGKTGLHAIRALANLALQPGEACVDAASVAKEIGAPPNYLGKLLQSLVREGLVESRKGLGGGFRLARDARRITLLDVVEPFEQISRWSDCFLGHPVCSDDAPCPMHDRWGKLRDNYVEMLSQTTIADLIRMPRQKDD